MYGLFAAEASEGSTSDTSLQKIICDKIDAYYKEVHNKITSQKVECTRNLVSNKQHLISEFMKIHMKSKTKECPHCKSLLRDIR